MCGMWHEACTDRDTCARIAADYSCEMCPFTPNHSGCIMLSVALALPVIGLIKDTSKGKNTETKRNGMEDIKLLSAAEAQAQAQALSEFEQTWKIETIMRGISFNYPGKNARRTKLKLKMDDKLPSCNLQHGAKAR